MTHINFWELLERLKWESSTFVYT